MVQNDKTCAICDKEFERKSHLKKHERIHTNEKPFQCEYCEKKFTAKSNLNKHLTIHTKDIDDA